MRVNASGSEQRWTVLVMTFLAYLYDSLDLQILAICMPVIIASFKISLTDAGLLASATMIGTAIGGVAFGWVAENFGRTGKFWLGIAFLLAGAATINTLMAALPRILYGMACDGALPKVFAYLHPRYKSPVVGIVVSALIPIVHTVLIKGNLDRIMPLVLAAVCAWGTAYLLVNLSIVVLRFRRPDLPRAYKSPLFPLPQLLASVGIFIAIWYITPPGMKDSDIFPPFISMLALTAVYAVVWIKLVKRLPGFTPVSVELVLEEEFGRHAE